MATTAVEDYLKCILTHELRSPERLVTMGQVAAALKVAPGSVTSMVKTLAESSLVEYEPYAGVRLTASGRKLALHVLRRHRLVELFLVKVMGFELSEVHEEAERLEHVISDRLLERMDEMLERPAVDPHGDPIPTAQGQMTEPDLPDLLHCAVGAELQVARVDDRSPEFLQLLEQRRLLPGSRLQVVERNEITETVDLALDGGERMSLGSRAAAKIQVRPASHP